MEKKRDVMARFISGVCCLILSLGLSLGARPCQAQVSALTPVVPSFPTTLYTNAAEKVSFQIPSDWTVKEINQRVQGSMIRMAAFRATLDKNETLPVNISLIVMDLDTGVDLSRFIDLNLKNLSAGLSGFKNEDSGDIGKAATQGKYLVYSYQYPKIESRSKVMVFLFVKDKKGYSLTCSSTVGNFSKYKDLFLSTGKSFIFNF